MNMVNVYVITVPTSYQQHVSHRFFKLRQLRANRARHKVSANNSLRPATEWTPKKPEYVQ